MNGLPLQPAIVHLPLGLAIILPLAAIVVAVLAWRGRAGRALLTSLAIAQAALVISGYVAMQLGESDEEVVEPVVGEAALESHEERAETFIVVAAAVLVTLGAAAALSRQPVGRILVSVGAAGTVAVAALGLAVGHSGGELVYVHGAAAAHVSQAGAAGAPAPGRESRGGEGHDDRDDD